MALDFLFLLGTPALQNGDWAPERNQGVATRLWDTQGGCTSISQLAHSPSYDTEANRQRVPTADIADLGIMLLIQL